MNKSIVAGLAVLAGLGLAWYFFQPTPYTPAKSSQLSPAFDRFKSADFSKVAKIVIAKGKENPAELKKEGSQWVVGSLYGYPADEKKVEKILESAKKISSGDEAGKAAQSHESFEVDKKKGGSIAFHDQGGNELAKLVVGKSAPGGGISANRIFARFGDEDVTYRIESDIRSEASLYSKDVEGKSYLLKDIFEIKDDQEVQTVRIVRPNQPDLLVERRSRDVPLEKPEKPEKPAAEPGTEEEKAEEGKSGEEAKEGEKKEEKKKPETKKEQYFVVTSGNDTKEVGKSEESAAKSLLDYKKKISIDDAAEPKDLKEYGLDQPQVKAILSYRKKDDPQAEVKTLTIMFGNAKKNEKGEDKDVYFAIDDEKFKGRVYVVHDYQFEGWKKEMKDFSPKPKEEPKPPVLPVPPVPPAPEAEGETPAGAPKPPPAGQASPPSAKVEGEAPVQPPLPETKGQ